jgi:hypothetical protein
VERVRSSSEAEVVAEFLRAEIGSLRFGLGTAEEMVRHAATLRMLQEPNLGDANENERRQQILGATRGWRRDEGSFAGFPAAVRWELARLEARDIRRLRFSSSPDWHRLTGGSMRPVDLVRRMREGLIEPELMEVPEYERGLAGIAEVARALVGGAELPPPILVSCPGDRRIWIAEGFTRVTALILAGRWVGAQVLSGTASRKDFQKWVGTGPPVGSSLRALLRTAVPKEEGASVRARVGSTLRLLQASPP